MHLELTSAPRGIIGSAIGFASIPWTLPLATGVGLREQVLKATDAFINQYGPGFGFRLVLETRQEWAAIERAHADIISASPNMFDERLLALWLDLDSVEWPGPRGLTPLENAAAAQLAEIMNEQERRLGSRPNRLAMGNEQARKNLARVGDFLGLAITTEDEAALSLETR